AQLSFSCAILGLSATLVDSPVLVADIGGGSTEFVLGDATSGLIASMCSVDVGCVRMTERHLHGDPPTIEQIDQAVVTIDHILDSAFAEVDVSQVRTFVGLAGSVTTVAAIAHRLPEYDPVAIHGSVTSLQQVEQVADRLVGMTRAERSAEPVMHPGRVDVIAGGALVLRQIMRRLPVGLVVASETDVLDGIVYRLSTGVA
ncbi:MAG: exopolyphosphatase, partial [Candidatus Nanopelagicales bacterium]